MIILTLSPSAYNSEDGCQQRYFIENVLRWRGPANFAADKGSFVHSCLEFLALAKLAQQNNETEFDDPLLGKCSVDYNLIDVFDRFFAKYQEDFPQWDWEYKRGECKQWFVKAITYNDNAIDPRKLKIVQPEKRFSIPIEEDWARYKYKSMVRF